MPYLGDSSPYNSAAKWNGSSWQVGFQAPSAAGGAPGAAVGGMAGTVATQAAAAADPFAGQRPQYQGQLSSLMGGPAQGQVNGDIQTMRDTASKPIGGPYMDMLQNLMTNKDSITMTPGSQFAMDQGQKALERSNAAKGFLGSGNILSALQTQAQGQASQDYTQQLADTRAAAGLSQGVQGQQFSQQGQVAGASGKEMDNQASRLALLSGASTGQPGTAGSLLAKQFDWANQGTGGGSSSGGASGGGVDAAGATNTGGVFRDSFGNLQLDTAQAHVNADNSYRNWGRSSLL